MWTDPFQSDDEIPLYRQIYRRLRTAVETGRWSPGDRLPSTREMARRWGVARMTVIAALEQLQLEGFIDTRPGSGSYVAAAVPAWWGEDSADADDSAALDPPLSTWGRRLRRGDLNPERRTSRRSLSTPPTAIEIDFGFGRSFDTVFPYDVWRRLLGRYLSTDDAMLARYGSAAGFAPLRQAIADHLARPRGVRGTAEQIVIVNGIQQAVDILARLLLNAGDEVLVETPGYANAYKVFRAYGAQLTAVPVDDHGFNPARIPADCAAKLAFITPSNQFPHGGTMPLPRRLALLDWARRHNAYIIEDDYDGELRYDGDPLAAVQGVDRAGRVIYLGTFSKVLFPALRLGYVVLPAGLQRPFLQAKRLMDRGAPTLTQAAVADFITEGHFGRHLRRLRQVYGRRRAALVSAVRRHLGDAVSFADEAAGLQLLLRLPEGVSEQAVLAAARRRGVAVYAAAPYAVGEREPHPAVLLGFSAVDESQIDAGVRRLAAAVDEVRA